MVHREVEKKPPKPVRKWNLSPTGDLRAQEMRREQRRGGSTDRRREMARRLGTVLLVPVVIAALAGVFAGDGFGVGEAETVGEEKTGLGARIREVGEMVLPWAMLAWTVVIGVATWLVMREQKRLAEREGREKQWERRYRAVEAVLDFMKETTKPGRVGMAEVAELAAGAVCRAGLFGEEGEVWLVEFGELAVGLSGVGVDIEKKEREIMGLVKAGKREVAEGKEEERTRLVKRREEIEKGLVDKVKDMKVLLDWCWGKEGE